MTKSLSVWILLSLVTLSRAADSDWKTVATDLLQREKTGFGGLCGMVVDHMNGDVFVNLSDRGMFHSGDQGQTWKRVSDAQPKGRTETPGCWLLDPTGKSNRMVTALVYGSPVSVSGDRAATWKSMDSKSSHSDWCAVDWTDPEMRFVLALKHEAGGLLLSSSDGGQSFVEVGKGHGTGWVFDNQIAVVAQAKSKEQPNPHLMRTTDRGQTFHSCGEFSPVGTNSAQALPKWRDGTLYWLVDGGLITTADKGETWKKIGEIKDAQYGPIFGKKAQHLFVLTKAGPVESTDGGITWSPPLVPPKEMKGVVGLSWLEYDPQHDTLYLMKMGSDLYRLTRGK
ncbi:MAG: exo-alpha-sialidase [Planctomycetaceae bacterium]|nr:exo-alpha-sialidase [Planctomycetaceae bacterium]